MHACIHTYVRTSIHPYIHTSIRPYVRTYVHYIYIIHYITLLTLHYITYRHILHSHSHANTDEKGMCPGWPRGVVGCSAACWVVPWATATGISVAGETGSTAPLVGCRVQARGLWHLVTTVTFSDTLWLCQNSYWKWPFIVDLPIKNGDFP